MKSTGSVISLTGVVKAIATDGTERILRVGDRVFADEQIVTGDAGAIAIEFADGSMMDLGRNAQSILDEETLNLDFDIKPKDTTAAEDEVLATQTALLQDRSFDPTVDLPAPAAGSTPVAGAGDDDGFSIIQVDYAEPRMTPVSGFETTGIGVDFTEILPELILDPQQIQGAGLGGAQLAPGIGLPPIINPPPPPPPPPSGTPPEVSTFTLNEESDDKGEPPGLINGDSSKFLGFRIAPSAEDAVTSVTIKGFPENDNLMDESDWLITPLSATLDTEADYQVNFQSGPTLSSDGTWEITIGVTGALAGEEIAFIIPVIPMDTVATRPLDVETTVNNDNSFSTIANIDITYPELLEAGESTVISNSFSLEGSTSGDSSVAGSTSFIVPASGSSSINQYLQDTFETTPGFDVM